MDWTNSAHVLQAIYWTLMFVVFVYGYSIGNRSAS